MERQQVLDTLDSLAASLSALATEVNKLYLQLQMQGTTPAETEPKARSKGHTATRWLPEEKKTAIRLAIDEKKTAEEIGLELKRTPAAIMAQLRKSLNAPVYQAWMKRRMSA